MICGICGFKFDFWTKVGGPCNFNATKRYLKSIILHEQIHDSHEYFCIRVSLIDLLENGKKSF